MDKQEFETKLKRAMGGQGGKYFRDNYFEALNDPKETLQKLAKDTKNEIEHELGNPKLYDDYFETEIDQMRHWMKTQTETNKQCYKFFCLYLSDKTCSFPELCGFIVGAMAKEYMFEEALELIGMNDIDEEDEIYWDS